MVDLSVKIGDITLQNPIQPDLSRRSSETRQFRPLGRRIGAIDQR